MLNIMEHVSLFLTYNRGQNNVTNDKVYQKVAILMYTEMFNFRSLSIYIMILFSTSPYCLLKVFPIACGYEKILFFVGVTLTFVHACRYS